jgi:hypothetical protein
MQYKAICTSCYVAHCCCICRRRSRMHSRTLHSPIHNHRSTTAAAGCRPHLAAAAAAATAVLCRTQWNGSRWQAETVRWKHSHKCTRRLRRLVRTNRCTAAATGVTPGAAAALQATSTAAVKRWTVEPRRPHSTAAAAATANWAAAYQPATAAAKAANNTTQRAATASCCATAAVIVAATAESAT